MKHVEVAIGIIHQAGWVLICQRRKNDTFADLWEFPGGKIEKDESPEECVVREVAEELGISVRPTAEFPVIAHQYPELSVRIHPYLCLITKGNPRPRECQRMQWIQAGQLTEYPFLPANAELIGEIIVRLSRCDIPEFCVPGSWSMGQ